MSATAVIFDAVGRVLLVRHGYGAFNWELPGGGCESGESASEALQREVAEETHLSVAPERLTGVYYERDLDCHHFVFACRPIDDKAPNPSPPEIQACAYWPVETLPRPMHDFTLRRIHDALRPADLLLPIEIPARRWLA